MMPHVPDMGGVPNVWSVYLATENSAETAAKVAASGGTVAVEPMNVDPYGWMGIYQSPGGEFVGSWQPNTHPGFELLAEPGTFAWFEAITKDYDAAHSLYEGAFDWNIDVMSDTDEFRYATLGSGAEAAAGLMDGSMFLEDHLPGLWQVYINVENVDEAVAKVQELGGQVLEEAADTDFGRIAFVADSTGSRFRLHQELAVPTP
jgi:predicted enzyme related to lactoylglutathione lyase